MKISIGTLLFLASSIAFGQLQPMTLHQAQEFLAKPIPQEIQKVLTATPQEYSFYNSEGENTVRYTGQTMRNVLINDSKLAFLDTDLVYGKMQGKEKTVRAKLNSYFNFNTNEKGSSQIQEKMKNEVGEEVRVFEFKYLGIYGKEISLRQKIAGVDNALRHGQLLGWNSSKVGDATIDKGENGVLDPEDLYIAMIEAVVKNATGSEAYFDAPNGDLPTQSVSRASVTREGLDLAQLSQKLLHGAVSFSQAAGDYTSVDLDPAKKKGLLGDNTALIEGEPFTTLQHNWDEAFGYFGAARNYLEYSDRQISDGLSIDRYRSRPVRDENKKVIYSTHSYVEEGDKKDKRYSIGSEKNLGLSINAAKRDLGATLGNEDFTQAIMEAFLKGRQLVQEKPEGYLPYAQSYAVTALYQWERVIIATTIHYINEVVDDLEKYGTSEFKFLNLAKHFSEMKGFALAPQFNPNSVLFEGNSPAEKVARFNRVHELLGDRPVDLEKGDVKAYIEALLEARSILREAYNFDHENVEAW